MRRTFPFPVMTFVLLVCAGALAGCKPLLAQKVPTGPGGNIVRNGGFEQRNGDLPTEWSTEAKAAKKGMVSVVQGHAHGGTSSLRLAPNGNNTDWHLSNNPLGVGEGFPAADLRGKRLYVSAWMGAEGGALAVVQLVALYKNGAATSVRLAQASSPSGMVFRNNVFNVPNDKQVQTLILLCLVEGTGGAAYIDDVFVSAQAPASWPLAGSPDPGDPLQASIAVDADRPLRRIPETLFGTNIEWIWDGNGLWDEKAGKLSPDLIRLARDLGVSVYRFPGGIFADFYHWKDGVGPRGSRGESEHSPGGPRSVHRFGTDEALDFANQAGGQLMMTVNIVTGTPEEAAEWVRYTNKSGRSTPPVRYWELGNEQYVKDNSAHSRPATMPPDKYAKRFLEFASAMRAVDPSIRLGAVSDVNFGHVAVHPYPDWTETVLRIAGREVDFVAAHCAYAPGMFRDDGWNVRTVYSALMAAPPQIHATLEALAATIRRVIPDRASRVPIAVTEWGPYFEVLPSGRFVHHVKTLGSALFVASTLKAFAESPRTEIATFFKLNDALFMGWIGLRGGVWTPTPNYYAFQLFTRHFGRQVVSSSTDSPGFNSPEVGLVDPGTDTPYLDVIASLGDDGKTLYVLGVNKHFDRAIRARISLKGYRPSGSGTAWVLNGTGLDANTGTELYQDKNVTWARQATDETNPRFDRGGPEEVTLTSKPVGRMDATFEYTFPAHSVTSLEIPRR